MNAQSTVNKSSNKIWRLFILVPLFLLSSCMETIFTVQFPQSGELYVDDELVDFVINYTTAVPTTDIYLNGSRITNEFNFGPSQAVASITDVKKYLRQGTNTLTVDPLAFGPTVTFSADTEGPEIVVTLGRTSGGNSTVEVGGELRDPSELASLSMQMILVGGYDETTGQVTRFPASSPVDFDINADGTFYQSGIDISSGVTIYAFTATDIHGHQTYKEYLADSSEDLSLAISNAMRMAIGETFVESLRPVIASGLYEAFKTAPIDVRSRCWDDPLIEPDGPASQDTWNNDGFCDPGQDGSTMPAGIHPLVVNYLGMRIPTELTRLFMDTGSTVLLNKFQLAANDRLDIDMVITNMTAGVYMTPVILFWELPVDMTLKIGTMVVDTGAVMSAQNKKVHVELTDSDFVMNNIEVQDAQIAGIDLTGIVDLIMPLLEGIIAGLLPDIVNSVLNDTLDKIVIGAAMLDKNDLNKEYFNWALNVETFKTDRLGAGASYDMIIGMETNFNLVTADPYAVPVLGPVYIEDPVNVNLIYNAWGATGTNLSFALSSNALNQAFASLYGAGLTHMAIVDGETTYGADPALPVGTYDGQTRMRLYPNSPPFFTLERLDGGAAGSTKASIGYESAVLYMDTWNTDIPAANKWDTQLELGVDFNIAANLVQINDAVQLGIEGSPEFNVNTVVNNTAFPVTQGMLQALMDIVTIYALPSLTENYVIIDLGLLTQNSLNGTKVAYLSDTDTGDQQYTETKPCDGGETQCVGGYYHVCDTLGLYGPTQSGPDLVCETIDFTVSTSAVTSIGDKGSNLFFQMEARDNDLPPAPAIPRLDLDNDTLLDYQDNCSASLLMLSSAVFLEGGLTVGVEGDGVNNMDIDGNPINNFKQRISEHINRWIADEQGQVGFTPGDYKSNPPVAGSGTPPAPGAVDIAWWNTMRVGDADINSFGSYPWIEMTLSNLNQENTDGDRVGELCEDDDDRDGIYTDNVGQAEDVCPSVTDPTNNPGYCSIDEADYVLFKNKRDGRCMSHGQFAGLDDGGPTNITENFTPGNSTMGTLMTWQACNPNDLGQRFYIDLATPGDDNHSRTTYCDVGVTKCERVVNIYTNEWKQVEPGFYDLINTHYVAATVATTASCDEADSTMTSSCWQYDDAIVTTMDAYENSPNGWRDWILSASGDANYPYFLENSRLLNAYSRRDCITNTGSANVDVNANSCINNVSDSSFQILLGDQQVEWTGRFSTD